MQLGSKENENERFAHYLEKTFKKTASLLANSCRAVSSTVKSNTKFIAWMIVFRTIPEFPILGLTFHRKHASKYFQN